MNRFAILLLFLLFLLAATEESQAQLSRRRLVAVPEIFVRPQLSSSKVLGRAMTDDVTNWIARKLFCDVIPRAETEKTIQELHFVFPLTKSEQQSVGKKLGADQVALSEIAEIEVTQNPHRARVKLSISLIDVTTGELINRYESTGFSPLTTKNINDETLIKWATERAVRTIPVWYASITSPTATILTVRNPVVVKLNRGSRDGFHPGDEMNVVRNSRLMGRLRILSVEGVESWAVTVYSREPFRPEDQAMQDVGDVLEKLWTR